MLGKRLSTFAASTLLRGSNAVQTVPNRGMATGQQLKTRIKSVTNIKKITKAMKMVAAAKLRAVQAQLEGIRVFQSGLEGIWEPVTKTADGKEPEKAPGDYKDFGPVQTHLIVPVTSDRGLCGGINSGINKQVRLLVANQSDRTNSIVCLGEKSRAGLERLYSKNFGQVITDAGKSKPVTFGEVSLIVENILSHKYDRISFVYNKFKSTISYVPTIVSFDALERAKIDRVALSGYNFEGNEEEVLESLYEFRMAVFLQHMFVENATSEQSARMTAMENSTKNASEMLDKLRLVYNRNRQAKITTELIEIISGATAAEEQTKSG